MQKEKIFPFHITFTRHEEALVENQCSLLEF
jgi:hypothetical protein